MSDNPGMRKVDLAALFEARFAEARESVAKGREDDAKRRLDGENSVIFFIRFSPIKSMGTVFVLAGCAAFSSGRFLAKHGLFVEHSQGAAIAITLLCECSILWILWISANATRHQSAMTYWQNCGQQIVSGCVDGDSSIQDVMKGLRISLYFYELRLGFLLAIVSALTLYSTLESRILSVNKAWGTRVLATAGVPEIYFTKIYTFAFVVIVALVFFGFYVPLSWRKTVKVLLDELVEDGSY